MIAVVDYGVGNLRSVSKALERVGADVRVTSSPRDLVDAAAVVLPDVTVGVQYEHYPISETNTTGSGNSYGAFVSIPLFVRHSYGGYTCVSNSDKKTAIYDVQNDRFVDVYYDKTLDECLQSIR